jgi:hypothetical protein
MRVHLKEAIGSIALLTALLAAQTTFAQPIDSPKSLRNRAVAASPRAKEQFPELIRGAAGERPRAPAGPRMNVKRGIAANPRALEQFPELSRTWVPDKSGTVPTSVLRNAALAGSPRVIEQYPWLARRGSPPREEVQIAPLK